MVEEARELKFRVMAGSSLPVTWRLPPLEVPLGLPMNRGRRGVAGTSEIFGFHALRTLQCMTERGATGRGKAPGAKSVTCLEGDAVWEAGDRGVWSWDLLEHALARSESRNVGDIKQNTSRLPPPARA